MVQLLLYPRAQKNIHLTASLVSAQRSARDHDPMPDGSASEPDKSRRHRFLMVLSRGVTMAKKFELWVGVQPLTATTATPGKKKRGQFVFIFDPYPQTEVHFTAQI